MADMDKFALVSVSEKAGLETILAPLRERGVKLLSTGGTAAHLQSLGYAITAVSDYTNSPEVLGGRVKTLHPKVHGGILARRDIAEDMAELEALGAGLIDYVIVNLYPFQAQVERVKRERSTESLVEWIDIGGPAMLRAAAKNFKFVTTIIDPADYIIVAEELSAKGEISLQLRRKLAAKVFSFISAYDAEIAKYLNLEESYFDESGNEVIFAPYQGATLTLQEQLRYGENPHQLAAIYELGNYQQFWLKEQGKQLSYNNLTDLEAACLLTTDLAQFFAEKAAVVIIKHGNPCGVAVREDCLGAFRAAQKCDPLSAFGGIISSSVVIDESSAQAMTENFIEVVVAPGFSEGARAVFAKKQNLRLIQFKQEQFLQWLKRTPVTLRTCLGQLLLQTADNSVADLRESKVVCGELKDLAEAQFAWIVCKHVKSNAIVISSELQAIGIGAGQMSRIDSARLAVERALANGFSLSGAVAASDAFLPFPDTLEILAKAGVSLLVQPGGSVKDDDVMKRAVELNVSMVLTGMRHFRH